VYDIKEVLWIRPIIAHIIDFKTAVWWPIEVFSMIFFYNTVVEYIYTSDG